MYMSPIAAIPRKKYRRHLPLAIGGTILIIVIIAVVMMIKNFISASDEPPKRRVQQISLIKPPEPPPPAVKPPEEKPPEIKEEVKLDEPPQEPIQTDQAPPGIGSAGYGNGDTSFGGGGGWAGANRFGGYLGGVQNGIREELDRNKKLRKGEYKIIISLWIDHGGKVSRFELVGSSGNMELDAAMKKVLSNAKFEEPPSDMPQPVKLRISSR